MKAIYRKGGYKKISMQKIIAFEKTTIHHQREISKLTFGALDLHRNVLLGLKEQCAPTACLAFSNAMMFPSENTY